MENTSNTVISYDGIEIYKSDIDILCDEYIDRLPSPEKIYEPNVFIGMLDYIYNTKLCFFIRQSCPVGSRKPLDYELLDNVFWNIYIPLCGQYNITPTIIMFCSMLHLDTGNIDQIKHGSYRNGYPASKAATRIVQKWYDRTESGLLSRTVEKNSIGAIFTLKSKYQYNDQSQSNVNITVNQVEHNPDMIADVLRIAENGN